MSSSQFNVMHVSALHDAPRHVHACYQLHTWWVVHTFCNNLGRLSSSTTQVSYADEWALVRTWSCYFVPPSALHVPIPHADIHDWINSAHVTLDACQVCHRELATLSAGELQALATSTIGCRRLRQGKLY